MTAGEIRPPEAPAPSPGVDPLPLPAPIIPLDLVDRLALVLGVADYVDTDMLEAVVGVDADTYAEAVGALRNALYLSTEGRYGEPPADDLPTVDDVARELDDIDAMVHDEPPTEIEL